MPENFWSSLIRQRNAQRDAIMDLKFGRDEFGRGYQQRMNDLADEVERRERLKRLLVKAAGSGPVQYQINPQRDALVGIMSRRDPFASGLAWQKGARGLPPPWQRSE